MPELLILRHGESASPAGTADFDRSLKARGKQDSACIGRWLIRNDLVPDFVISSPANRAIATARIVCEAMNLEPDTIHESRDIYLAELETLLRIVSNLPHTAQRAMIVGHNPGLEELLAVLSKTSVSPYDENGRLQPCSLVVLHLPGAWDDIAAQTATRLHLIRPSALPPGT